MEPLFLGALAVWKYPDRSAKPKARVLLIHGISEHSGRHFNTIRYLNDNGFEVIAFDLRGSGRSGGRRQWVEKFQDYVDDTTQVYNWISSTLPPLPLFVLGHSLGGAIAPYFALRYSKVLRGVVLSAPAYKVGGAINPLMIKASHILSKLTPGLRVPKAGDPGAVSRDPRSVKEYINDPLCTHFNTVRQANEVLTAIGRLPAIAAGIECPVLIVHGTGDQIIRIEGSFEILQNIPHQERTLHVYPGGFHELHNDLEKERYFHDLGVWLQNHL